MQKLQTETDPKTPRWSQEYFRLRKTEDMLFKQKRYPEAADRKQRAEALEKIETAEWEESRNKKIKSIEKPFLTKQQQAIACYKKKSERVRFELVNKKNVDRDTIKRNYASMKATLEEQHQYALRKHDVYPGERLRLANSLVLNK